MGMTVEPGTKQSNRSSLDSAGGRSAEDLRMKGVPFADLHRWVADYCATAPYRFDGLEVLFSA